MNSSLCQLLLLFYVYYVALNILQVHSETITELNDTIKDTNVESLVESNETTETSIAIDEGRGFADSIISADYEKTQDHHAAFRKRAKPLKNIFMGIYKNYKSTYLGNHTSQEYRQAIQERLAEATRVSLKHAKDQAEHSTEQMIDIEGEEHSSVEDKNKESAAVEENEAIVAEATTEATHSIEDSYMVTTAASTTIEDRTIKRKKNKAAIEERILKKIQELKEKFNKKRRKRKEKNKKHLGHSTNKNDYKYNIGPGMNMSIDMSNEIVNVKLDGNNLKELMNGRWLNDNSEEGRGKKYEIITRVLPLFVIPFLIQSAIVPFIITKLKLLLMKSILVGKLAIFLLIISAIKNSSKMMQSYEVAPSYWAGEPSRRSELSTLAAAYNGYRVEGKPATWIN